MLRDDAGGPKAENGGGVLGEGAAKVWGSALYISSPSGVM